MLVFLFSLSRIPWVTHILNAHVMPEVQRFVNSSTCFCAVLWSERQAFRRAAGITCFFMVAGCCQIGDIASRAWNDMQAGQCVPLADSATTAHARKRGNTDLGTFFTCFWHDLIQWYLFIKKRNHREGVKISSLALKLSPLLPRKVATTTTPCTSTFSLELCLSAEGIQGAGHVKRRCLKSAHFMEEWFEILLLF